MNTIEELFNKYGKGRFGKHFRVRRNDFTPGTYFEVKFISERNQCGGVNNNGDIQVYPWNTDNRFEIVKEMRVFQSAIVLNKDIVTRTLEMFENEDDARRFCLKNRLVFLELDTTSKKIDTDLLKG